MTTIRLHRYAVFVAISTIILILIGGLVASTGSGLSVPDWPLSFGRFFPKMSGGVAYEHTDFVQLRAPDCGISRDPSGGLALLEGPQHLALGKETSHSRTSSARLSSVAGRSGRSHDMVAQSTNSDDAARGVRRHHPCRVSLAGNGYFQSSFLRAAGPASSGGCRLIANGVFE
jgi:hypothetical protein